MKKVVGLVLVMILGLINSYGSDRNTFNITLDNFSYQYNGATNKCISWNFDYKKEFIWYVREGSWVVYNAPSKWKEGTVTMIVANDPKTKEEVTMIFTTTYDACIEAIKLLNKN